MTFSRAASLGRTVLPLSASAPEEAPLRRLTTQLARGDDLAWAQFHREYGPVIFRQLLAATRGDHALASEALQQTYLRIARYVQPCEQETMFRAWLRTVARTALSDCRRRQKSFWTLLLRRHADPSDVGDSTADDRGLLLALDTALTQIDSADRALLEGKYFNGADVRTLAATLAISEKAVESRLTRAREALRKNLLAVLARHE